MFTITKTKKKLVGIGILVVIVATTLIFFMGIRWEFKIHLEEKYPDKSFKIGLLKIDPIYGRFYTTVTCLNDGTIFPISRSFKTKNLDEEYLQYKSQNQYNLKIKSVFDRSDIKGYIKDVVGGGETPFENESIYNNINIHLADDAEHVSLTKKVLYLLKENQISAERIILRYEKEKHVYEILLSSQDYDLTENEIKARVTKIK